MRERGTQGGLCKECASSLCLCMANGCLGAVDEQDLQPYYSEDCAAKFAVTYSNGDSSNRNIVTADVSVEQGYCTSSFSGTSAAAPMAAGVIALVLEVR